MLGGFLALPLQLKCFLTFTGNKVELSRFHLAEKKDLERFDSFQVDTQQLRPIFPLNEDLWGKKQHVDNNDQHIHIHVLVSCQWIFSESLTG